MSKEEQSPEEVKKEASEQRMPSPAPETSKEEMPEVEQELSKVATNPKQNMVILVAISLVFLYLVYSLFFSGDSNKGQETTPMPDEVTQPVEVDVSTDIPAIPTLPSPPKLEDPTPPPPPPTEALPEAEELPPLPSGAPNLPGDQTASGGAPAALPFGLDEDAQRRQEAKRKSAIVLIAGTPPQKTPEEIQQEAEFKYRGDMYLVLGRGKIIDAIIETAVSSDFGGEIRAIVSRDIYSEWGKNILIPKGSRVFGNYATGISGAYGRVSIEWTRIDLANGYTVNIGGTGVDALGRKGNQGRVDNKFRERFSNAVLRSAFNITLANVLDSIVKPQIDSETAANRNETATNIKNIANGIFAQPAANGVTAEQDATQKRVQICSSVQSSIQDKTSSTYTTVVNACNSLATQANATEVAKLTSLMSTINSSSDQLIQNTNANVEESKAQEASKKAFEDIANTVKTLIEEQEFKPTITIDQGTPVKIYVNKDYRFPKAAVSNSRTVK